MATVRVTGISLWNRGFVELAYVTSPPIQLSFHWTTRIGFQHLLSGDLQNQISDASERCSSNKRWLPGGYSTRLHHALVQAW